MSTAITGVILSGGEGRRMGGADKGLQILDGQPMVSHVIARIAPQVAELIISANRHREQYAALGYPVIADTLPADASRQATIGAQYKDKRTAGPLAGLQAGLCAAKQPLVLFAPCDMPALPTDLATRLLGALQAAKADVAVATIGGRTFPVLLLARRETLGHLSAAIARGERKADAWYAGLRVATVAFDNESTAFVNINTPQDLAAYEKQSAP